MIGEDYRQFDLVGDHYACGLAMGQATALRVIPGWKGNPADIVFAEACAEVVRAHHAPLLYEYQGYADGQNRTWEEVLPHFSLGHDAGAAGGCSTMVWRAEDGAVMVARNYDFTVSQRARHLVRSAPPGVQPALGTNASLIGGRYDGVNAAGLFVALHLVRTTLPARLDPGVPFHTVPRILLETCVTAREALERLLEMPVMHSFNYVMADARDFFAVEAFPGAMRVREGRDILTATNHYQHPAMVHYGGRRKNSNSRRRDERLQELWRERRGAPWQWAQSLLADHAGPMCNHDRHLSTLWSVVADLSRHRVAYCMGRPCETPFVEMAWPAQQ